MTNANSNVTTIESKQTAPPAKFIVSAVVDSFPVQVEVEGKASDLRAIHRTHNRPSRLHLRAPAPSLQSSSQGDI